MMKRRNIRTLYLIVVTFTYLLVGAAIFDALEGPNNEKTYHAVQEIKADFVARFNITQSDYRLLELLAIEKKSHRSGPQWKFAGSFYYALVVLTLIGYGHSTPATNLGKAFTMFYATAGIPMAMVMFQSMGERMNKFYSVVIKKFRTWNNSERTEATELDLIVASGFTSSIVIWTGALIYHIFEGWTFFDSLYYTFITLSTIGFGDFVALQNTKALQLDPPYVVFSFVFLLVGLAALSSSINLLVLRFMVLSLEDEDTEQDENHLDARSIKEILDLNIDVSQAIKKRLNRNSGRLSPIIGGKTNNTQRTKLFQRLEQHSPVEYRPPFLNSNKDETPPKFQTSKHHCAVEQNSVCSCTAATNSMFGISCGGCCCYQSDESKAKNNGVVLDDINMFGLVQQANMM